MYPAALKSKLYMPGFQETNQYYLQIYSNYIQNVQSYLELHRAFLEQNSQGTVRR